MESLSLQLHNSRTQTRKLMCATNGLVSEIPAILKMIGFLESLTLKSHSLAVRKPLLPYKWLLFEVALQVGDIERLLLHGNNSVL